MKMERSRNPFEKKAQHLEIYSVYSKSQLTFSLNFLKTCKTTEKTDIKYEKPLSPNYTLKHRGRGGLYHSVQILIDCKQIRSHYVPPHPCFFYPQDLISLTMFIKIIFNSGSNILLAMKMVIQYLFFFRDSCAPQGYSCFCLRLHIPQGYQLLCQCFQCPKTAHAFLQFTRTQGTQQLVELTI